MRRRSVSKRFSGKENVYKAGTISAVKDRIAYGYVARYFEEREISVNKAEMDRLTDCGTVEKDFGTASGRRHRRAGWSSRSLSSLSGTASRRTT